MPMRPPAGFISAFYDPLKNPDAPTGVAATGGDASASVSFTPPSNAGGSAISAYYAVSNPDQITGTAASSPVSVTGLTNGTAYTFTVWALNTYGPGPFSAASGSVTPAVPPIGLFGGGYATNVINKITITTTGNATDFGDLTVARGETGACSSSTRGVFAGGGYYNIIDFVTFSTAGNATDFGDISQNVTGTSAFSSSTRGVINLGYRASPAAFLSTIQYITIASAGNAIDFGNLLFEQQASATCASPTRGVTAGGYTDPFASGLINVIQYVTIATTGNATDFGDLPTAIWHFAGCSNSTRGVFGGGDDRNVGFNVINYITIASTGNAIDFGDLTTTRNYLGACASSTRAVFGGGGEPATNVIDYITIATTGNATDFGDLPTNTNQDSGCSSAHGGL